ncbi:putative F-box/kelch-repeat protein At1g15680 [Henckelia pumila]|uniref:putative F-box/kelch-repeat protein At1g15680 n=1 Tax=Henckelia pumila TaxID=405737 RepID=UPI003C6DCCD4
MDDRLPESILMEVLLRLPLLALHRFKVVCKDWLSLTSTDYFLDKYKLYATRGWDSSRWAFVSCKAYDCSESHDPVEAHELLIDLHSGDLKCPIPNRSKDDVPTTTSSYRIMGVSNGLVLYQWWIGGSSRNEVEHGPNWGVCNPVTRQRVVLPRGISEHHWRDIWGLVTRTKDGVVASFTVVRYGLKLSGFEVFSSETGEWKHSHAYINLPRPAFLHRTPTDVGGILHWIIYCPYDVSGIVAFDPRISDSRVIPLPVTEWNNRRIGMCGTHDGHLRYVEFAAKSLRVWELKDYGRGDNWLLQHRTTVADILQDVHLERATLRSKTKLKPICFHPLDPDVVYLGCNHGFLSYNMREGKSQVLKTCHAPRDGSRYYKWRRAFCLVIPPLQQLIPSSCLS